MVITTKLRQPGVERVHQPVAGLGQPAELPALALGQALEGEDEASLALLRSLGRRGQDADDLLRLLERQQGHQQADHLVPGVVLDVVEDVAVPKLLELELAVLEAADELGGAEVLEE